MLISKWYVAHKTFRLIFSYNFKAGLSVNKGIEFIGKLLMVFHKQFNLETLNSKQKFIIHLRTFIVTDNLSKLFNHKKKKTF